MRFEAESVLEKWEKEEGESMREGHKETLLRLMEKALEEAYDKGACDQDWSSLGSL